MAAELEFAAVTDFGLEAAADVFARGFADYLVRIPATAAMLLAMARADSVDLGLSRVLRRDGVAVGAALIARRGWTCRLAGMALVPEARRQGLGGALLRRLLAEAGQRGDRAMVLEVIEQNPPAVALYEGAGFRRVRRLAGYEAAGEPPATDRRAERVDPRAVATAVAVHGEPDLPWQISGETLAQLGPPAAGFQVDGVWLTIGDPAAAAITVRGLAVAGGSFDPERAGAALRAVRAEFPGRPWRASALFPEAWEPAWRAAGFTRAPLSQWQMVRACG